jgi:hypothetical protein
VRPTSKVIDIYEWRRPVKPGELPKGCVLVDLSRPTQTETSEQPRKIRPSEIAMAIASVALISLLIANYV